MSRLHLAAAEPNAGLDQCTTRHQGLTRPAGQSSPHRAPASDSSRAELSNAQAIENSQDAPRFEVNGDSSEFSFSSHFPNSRGAFHLAAGDYLKSTLISAKRKSGAQFSFSRKYFESAIIKTF